jgi:hypothetical protein
MWGRNGSTLWLMARNQGGGGAKKRGEIPWPATKSSGSIEISTGSAATVEEVGGPRELHPPLGPRWTRWCPTCSPMWRGTYCRSTARAGAPAVSPVHQTNGAAGTALDQGKQAARGSSCSMCCLAWSRPPSSRWRTVASARVGYYQPCI